MGQVQILSKDPEAEAKIERAKGPMVMVLSENKDRGKVPIEQLPILPLVPRERLILGVLADAQDRGENLNDPMIYQSLMQATNLDDPQDFCRDILAKLDARNFSIALDRAIVMNLLTEPVQSPTIQQGASWPPERATEPRSIYPK